MTENFFALSPGDRKEALEVAASKSGRPAHILEKDAWVVCHELVPPLEGPIKAFAERRPG
jgi:hypothetical protein